MMKVLLTSMVSLAFMCTLSAHGQTLASPPAQEQPKAATVSKPADSKLSSKVNAIIKSQNTQTPAKPTPDAPAKAPAVATAPAKPATESKVDRLITEREQLVLKYDYLKNQGSNFWGKASKEDMRAVIEALKEVLQKDEQIIHAVEQANLENRRARAQRAAELEAETKKLTNQVKGDTRVISDNIYDLKTSLANARNLTKRKDRMIKDLEEELQAAKDAKFEHDAIAAFFAMLFVLTVGYIVRLRNQLAQSRSKQHAKV